jgi:hypothetical protein
MDRRDAPTQAISRALGSLTQTPAPGSPSDWRFVLENGAKLEMRTRLVDEWFELTASTTVTPLRLAHAWSMLRTNAELTGPARVALAPDADEAHFRGEIFADDDGRLDTRISDLCEGARAACHALYDRTPPGRSGRASEPTAVAHPPPDGSRLVQLCTEAGWPHTERASGRVEVPIACGPAVYQAQLELMADGALYAVADLVDASALTSVARAATALLLLNTSAVVRSVKGVAVRRDGGERAGLAAACERPRSGADVDRALAALTVACDLAGREAQMLRDEGLAREYLAWHAPALLDDVSDKTQSDNHNQSALEERPCLQQL